MRAYEVDVLSILRSRIRSIAEITTALRRPLTMETLYQPHTGSGPCHRFGCRCLRLGVSRFGVPSQTSSYEPYSSRPAQRNAKASNTVDRAIRPSPSQLDPAMKQKTPATTAQTANSIAPKATIPRLLIRNAR